MPCRINGLLRGEILDVMPFDTLAQLGTFSISKNALNDTVIVKGTESQVNIPKCWPDGRNGN